MRHLSSLIAVTLLVSCAMGPTPERSGFDYPEAGVRFRPRRNVTSDTLRAGIASSEHAPYVLLFPQTTSRIESPYKRLLTTGIVGEWDSSLQPLHEEISVQLFGIEPQYSFELIEERAIELPWPGLATGSGTLRVFSMTTGEDESPLHTLAILVHHYGNTIEFCWRDQSRNPPDEEKLEEFFYWTHGLRFTEPEVAEAP